ncbi:unnamed protein product [Effrenium voratum]|uniref:Hint domain-containing protein n=1 Tax=Effrenium voratum TaxID=2562239 RepID=A0AA36HTB3_9DINO|nr:unnamed protein product [Effrenium voratum]
MAPALTWQTDGVVAFTAPWAAEASGGVELRPGEGAARAELEEVDGGGGGWQGVSRLDFADGGCVVKEWSGCCYVEVGRFPGGGVRWCWAKGPGGLWKVWAEADSGEKILLNQTFEQRAPQLVLVSGNNWRSLDISMLPLQPGPGSVPQVSQPSQAELRARVGQLTSEVQSERAQKAELQQRLAEITQQEANATQQQANQQQAAQQDAGRQEKQELQQQLEQLTKDKAEANQQQAAQQDAWRQERQELQQQLEQRAKEKAEANQQQAAQQDAWRQERQELQQQLEQLTKDKAEANQQQAAQQDAWRQEKQELQQQLEQLDKQELRQQLEQSRHDFALLSQQQLEQSRHDFALLRQEKAQAIQQSEVLQQEKQRLQQQLEQLRHDFMLASKQAPTERKLVEVARQLSQLKEHCDAVIAFISSDSDPQPEGDSPVSRSWAVIDQEDVQSVQSSDMSSASAGSAGSAKCFLPNTALAGAGSAEGHLLLVEHLKPGDKVRLSDGTEASVLDIKRHPSKKKPYDVVELSTHQGKFPVSDSHHVAVPGVTGPRRQQADALKQGDLVIVSGEQRKLTNMVPRKERANLFEVFLEPDGPLEMFHLKQSWSLQVFGSASGSGCLPEEEGEELLLTGSPS